MAPKIKKQKTSDAAPNKQKVSAAIEAASAETTISELLDNEQYGRTYTKELDISLKSGDDTALFQWLCCSILFSSGLSEALTMRACKVLFQEGMLKDVKTVQQAATESFVGALDHKYQRKEQTAKYLHSAASVLLDKYDGSLYRLREASKNNPEQIRSNLQEIKGLAQVGTDIFFREAQLVWSELVPFIDKRASQSARDMGLPDAAAKLYELVGKDVCKLATLAAALTRVSLAKDKGVAAIAEGLDHSNAHGGHSNENNHDDAKERKQDQEKDQDEK